MIDPVRVASPARVASPVLTEFGMPADLRLLILCVFIFEHCDLADFMVHYKTSFLTVLIVKLVVLATEPTTHFSRRIFYEISMSHRIHSRTGSAC